MHAECLQKFLKGVFKFFWSFYTSRVLVGLAAKYGDFLSRLLLAVHWIRI